MRVNALVDFLILMLGGFGLVGLGMGVYQLLPSSIKNKIENFHDKS